MKDKNSCVLSRIRGKLIVSCQALPHEPLYSSYIMGRMAVAAAMGGCCGIRANTVADIEEIMKNVNLPVIGIIKRIYGDNQVFITATMKEVDALAVCGVAIIATDATHRERPDGKNLEEFFTIVRERYPNQLFMADVSTYEEGVKAAGLGFDLVATTLCGYTEYTKGQKLPHYDLIHSLSSSLSVPVIAEGGIHSPEELRKTFQAGAFSAVVGGAITRPLEITKRFVQAIE